MCKKLLLCVFINFFLITSIFANQIYKLPSVVVTATKYPADLSKIGSNVQVITSEELKSIGANNLKDALALASDLSVINVGGNVSVFMGGLPSNQVKVLIDGIELKDSTTPQGTPYLDAILINNNVDYIEIVSGSKSSLYGTSASGGVINIITKKDKNYLNLEAGVNNYSNDLSYNFKFNTMQLNLGLSYLYDKSLSALKGTSELDGKTQTAFSLGLEDKTDYFSYRLFLKRNLLSLDLDYYGVPISFDDPNYVLNSTQDLGKITISLPEINQIYPTIIYSLASMKRESNNPTDNLNSANFENSTCESKINCFDISFLTKPVPNFDVLFGYENKVENASFSSDFSGWISTMNATDYVKSLYAQITYLNEVINFNGGLRYTSFEKNNIGTYSLSFFRNIPILDVITKVNYSTGYREPSLYEKYGLKVTSPLLNSEKSITKEISFEKKLFDATLKITFFDHLITDKIDYVYIDPITWEGQYQNVTGNTTSLGTELSFFTSNLFFLDFFKIDYVKNNATWGQNKATRIPDYKINCAAAVSFANFQIGFSGMYVGPQTDIGNVDLSAYYVLNSKIQYQFNEDVNAYLTCHNLLNRDYEEIKGYNVLGRTIKIGVNLGLNL